MSLKHTILSIIKQNIPVQVVTGEVMSVDETQMTCDVKIESRPDRLDVRIRSVIDGQEKGILIYPKTGSKVLVGLIENNAQSSFICGYSEVDKIRLIDCEIELNSGANGGLVISQKVADEVNEIKQDLNNLKAVFNSWVVVPSDGGAALKAAAATWYANQLTPVNKTDLENNKVKHG
jgi:hypothetical protein